MKKQILAILAFFNMSLWLIANPVVTNLTAMQRDGTQLVDIRYDVSAVTARVQTSLRISRDGGATFNVPAISLTGDIGAGIQVGSGKTITWNAEEDWPGQFSQSMRFEVSADDGQPAIMFTSEASEYFTRANVTDPYAKWALNEFVKGAKSLGIWDKLVYVPCLPSMGGLHQLGGAAQRTNTPWTLVNGTSVAEGVSIALNGYNNYLLSDQAVANQPTPVAYGSFACQAHTPNFHSWDYTTISISGANHRTVGQEFWSTPHRVNLRFAHNTFLTADKALVGLSLGYNNYKNSHLLAISSTHGSSAIEAICDEAVEARTLASGVEYTTPGRMRFYPAVTQFTNGAGLIQSAFLYYGTFAEAGYESWQKLRALTAQTILSGGSRSVGHRRLLLTGQSNAGGALAREISRQSSTSFGMFSVFNTNFGGQPIRTWIDIPQSNQRKDAYRNTLWSDNAQMTAFQKSRLIDTGKQEEYLVWFQGESDTEGAVTAKAYRQQLATLIQYFRQDTGNPNLKVVVIQVDYSPTLKHHNANGFFSAITPSGFVGGLSALNGSYPITPLTSDADPYVWTKDGYRVEQRNNQWVFVETANNAIVASAVEHNLPHPAMVTNWVDASSLPLGVSFGEGSRTEYIERVRYAQREICKDLPNVYTFDSRGYTRTDHVHIDEAALTPFATALNAFLLTLQ